MAKMAWLAAQEDEKAEEKKVEEGQQTELWHYHVTLVCPQMTISPVVTPYRAVAVHAYDCMINLVTYKTGLGVVEKTLEKATFEDGSTVRWFSCTKGCQIPVIPSIKSNMSQQEEIISRQ
jgi:hypothetical protein